MMARRKISKKYCPFRGYCLGKRCAVYLEAYGMCGLKELSWSIPMIASYAEDTWDVLNDIEKDLKQLVQILEKKQS
jgi:hypothetical protein